MERIAIIGSGIAGLGCAHFLHGRGELTIYESEGRPGGHTNTVTVDEDGVPTPIDTGFMVFNHATYPNLTKLFRELGVETKPTDMSFSVRHDHAGLEYNGGSLNLLFGQRRNLVRPRHWRLLTSIHRFNSESVAALEDPRWAEMTLGEYVEARAYGADMLNHYLVPMSSAVWSTPPEKMVDFPALTLLRFWHNHGFLGLSTQHQWWTVCGGARTYVEKIIAPFRDRLHTGRAVLRVTRHQGRAQVQAADGSNETFDKVIFACHGDQALRLIADPTELETRLLRPFAYQPNTATLHTDASVMPRTRRCWASWNYRVAARPVGGAWPDVHYWMNRLQGVSQRRQYFVSLNCRGRVAPDSVLREIDYDHPLFTLDAIRAQKELSGLNRLSPAQTIYFAGAWFKYGFHEDGFTSALECARAITGEPLWN
ncbi:MAG: NAD(P)/FAD-dependent oxidoreductase [Verrucomicrobiales bacterium]